MSGYKFRSEVTVSPSDVQSGDAFAIKIVGVTHGPDQWAAYQGPSEWEDQLVAESGDRLPENIAQMLFYVLAQSGRTYYR